ncbi:hypothetical protein F5Y09DRAFT_353496 [Xylaria sp. FL1042]|nr:hypothetical protein F5Y09DRAFT_353496 [Xylaria sp. FL1042]
MPKNRARTIPRASQIPTDFKFLMTQIWRKLEAEGRGRHRAFCHVMKAELIKVEAAQKGRPDSLLVVHWKLFEGVSNHFWPGSVRRADRPPQLNYRSRPVNKSIFTVTGADDMSFEELVDFIQDNGTASVRPKGKPKAKRKEEEMMRQLNSPLNNSTVLSPPPILSSRPILAHGVTGILAPLAPEAQTTQVNFGWPARPVWDDDIDMIASSSSVIPITKPQTPTLSFACRQGWGLSQKTISIPTAVTGHKPDSSVDKLAKNGSVQPSDLGKVLFTRVPEKDVEAFLSSFLAPSRAKMEAMGQTQKSES